jgi:hypothetical protein
MESASSEFPSGRTERTVLGFPLRGFGLFTSLLLSFALALMAFCFATMIAIFSLLISKMMGNSPDFSITYRYVGLPASLVVLAIALPFFLFLWIRAKFHQ